MALDRSQFEKLSAVWGDLGPGEAEWLRPKLTPNHQRPRDLKAVVARNAVVILAGPRGSLDEAVDKLGYAALVRYDEESATPDEPHSARKGVALLIPKLRLLSFDPDRTKARMLLADMGRNDPIAVEAGIDYLGYPRPVAENLAA